MDVQKKVSTQSIDYSLSDAVDVKLVIAVAAAASAWHPLRMAPIQTNR